MSWRAHPGDGPSVCVSGANAGPGVTEDGGVENNEHEHVGVVEPGEVIEHTLAEPRFLPSQQGFLGPGPGYVALNPETSLVSNKPTGTDRRNMQVLMWQWSIHWTT